ncbi:MAG: uroporphyrinogen decarboxylase family protein [Methylovulum sp.]|nr:uroporphyrinogen decarboxylase family protein [Methylovulum sp.]
MPNTWLTRFIQGGKQASPYPQLMAVFWRHHPLADQAAATLVAATLAFQKTTRGQLVKLTPAGNYQVAGRGGHAVWCGDPSGRRTFQSRAITTPHHWQGLSATLTPLEKDIVAAARSLRLSLPADIPLLATVFSPLTQALMLAGPAQLLAHLNNAPDAVLAGLESLGSGTQQLIAAYQAVGVNGIYLAAQHLSETLLPRPLYRELGKASDACIMAACADFEGNILHIHGPNIHFDGVPATGRWLIHYELATGNPSPADYRAACQFPVVIGLPFELWNCPERLKHAISTYLSDFNQHGALLTGPCVVPLAIPDDCIAAWIEGICHAS